MLKSKAILGGVAAVAACMLLAACGSGTYTPPVVVTPPAPVGDAFLGSVQSLVATSSDTDEPIAIDGIAVTAPEDNEPVPTT